MGRFGNVMLIGGETDPSLGTKRGEVVRFYLTNTANTRVFNVTVPGARIKLVGGDSGRHEHEEFVESVIIAPSERVVVDVLFEQPGRLALEHRTPERDLLAGKDRRKRRGSEAGSSKRVRHLAPQSGVGGGARAARSLR